MLCLCCSWSGVTPVAVPRVNAVVAMVRRQQAWRWWPHPHIRGHVPMPTTSVAQTSNTAEAPHVSADCTAHRLARVYCSAYRKGIMAASSLSDTPQASLVRHSLAVNARQVIRLYSQLAPLMHASVCTISAMCLHLVCSAYGSAAAGGPRPSALVGTLACGVTHAGSMPHIAMLYGCLPCSCRTLNQDMV